MKLLVTGGQGMAGHVMVRYLRRLPGFQVAYTTRDESDREGLLADARDTARIRGIIGTFRPDAVINCIGVLNQFAEADPVNAYRVNGIFPHELAEAALAAGGRLIHISTDCVFSGRRGDHTEDDVPDGTSVYGRSKALGEVREAPHLTVRTSIIGPEIRDSGIGLLHWFLSQAGEVGGYTRAYWNGVTTLELAKFVEHALHRPELTGLVHLTAPVKVSKYELLNLFRKQFGRTDIEVRKNASVRLNRTLKNTRDDLNYAIPGYETMLKELDEWMCAQCLES
ncbi:SDR family oxidoreductase [Paenibacillus sp. UNC499MF]|uniref:dTDP-4-dehydrorhamnose reductase family protein n=1 Tax=Paenibacillus sp. UNC499MF TaxID=1502751 RepID=UPI00089FAE88|nr:SDR family oxidoreductase [Paenibacillus sp. UNC499MF]SEG36582.1 dTDP-4-dehydrorhamnose reductase [Paenibacillus sp. UNC499MF]